MTPRESVTASPARCLHCGGQIAWHENPHRPFCSLSCRLIDLGVCLDERYRIPGPELPGENADDSSLRGSG